MTKFFSFVVDVKVLFKLAVFTTFITALVTFSVWFLSFMTQLYTLLKGASNDFATSSEFPNLLACLFQVTGLGTFFDSAFAIFFTAVTFWLTAVGYIIAYKLGNKAYDGLLQVAT